MDSSPCGNRCRAVPWPVWLHRRKTLCLMDCMRRSQCQVLWNHQNTKRVQNIYSILQSIPIIKQSLVSSPAMQYTLYLHVGIISCSTSRDQRDHSSWTAVIGWTACALLIVDADASDSPMYFIFPSSTSFLSSPICTTNPAIKDKKETTKKAQRAAATNVTLIVTSTGTVVSIRCW